MKIVYILFVFFLPLVGTAQITISVQAPPAGLLRKEQLWNLVVINGKQESQEIKILLSLRDAASGTPLLLGYSNNVNLTPGVKVISNKDLEPIQYDFSNSSQVVEFLPIGSYVASYSVVVIGRKGNETIAGEAVPLEIRPLSPPVLAQPSDKASLQTVTPQFNWLPPAPLSMFTNLSYDLQLVEVQKGQSPVEAIRYNMPVYNAARLTRPYEIYPTSYTSLEKGKQYAWQIIARNNDQYVAQTEIWTFKIADSTIAADTLNNYIVIKSVGEDDGVSYVSEQLLVRFYSYGRSLQTTVILKDADGKIIKRSKENLVYGDNFLKYKLDKRFEKDKIYTVELTDEQSIVRKASFSIK